VLLEVDVEAGIDAAMSAVDVRVGAAAVGVVSEASVASVTTVSEESFDVRVAGL
jgi:hypothetical protein